MGYRIYRRNGRAASLLQHFLVLVVFLCTFASGRLAIEFQDAYGRRMLNLAAAAYASDPQICIEKTQPSSEQWKVLVSKETVCDRKNNTCAGYVIVSDVLQQLIVAFRGTVGNSQLWLEAIDSMRPDVEWYGFGLVNRYFYNAHNVSWDYVEHQLRKPAYRDYDVTFVGYSLGGALASIAAMRVYAEVLRPMDKISLITFGEPRVGNIEYANNVDRTIASSFRVIHKADLIPHFPPCKDDPHNRKTCDPNNAKRAFHHSTEVWYPNDMAAGDEYKVCTKSDEDDTCSDSLPSFQLSDHLHYYGHNVGKYGAANCDDAAVDQSNTVASASSVSLLLPLVSSLLLAGRRGLPYM